MNNGQLVPQEVETAISQLWRSTVMVFAIFGVVTVTLFQRSSYVRNHSAFPEVINSGPEQSFLIVLWYLAVAIFWFFLFRNFILRPYLDVARSSLNRETTLKVCRRLGILAIPYALVFTVLLEIAFYVSDARFAFLAFLPLLLFWEWMSNRAKRHVEIALNQLAS